jgi:hypothetical protein
MKKIILVFVILFIVSCTTESEDNTDCNCGKVIQSTSFNALGNVFSVFTVHNNCTGIDKQIQRNGIVNVGTVICDY